MTEILTNLGTIIIAYIFIGVIGYKLITMELPNK